MDILSAGGILNQAIQCPWGWSSQLWLGSNDWFRGTIITSGFWKNVGFSTIVYLAALTAINPVLHEAAAIDGAGRFRRIWYITLPGIRPTIVLLAALSLGDVLQAGFEQILTLIQAGCLPHRRHRRYLRLPRRLDLGTIQPGGGGRFVQVIHRLHLDRAFVLDGGSFRRISHFVRLSKVMIRDRNWLRTNPPLNLPPLQWGETSPTRLGVAAATGFTFAHGTCESYIGLCIALPLSNDFGRVPWKG